MDNQHQCDALDGTRGPSDKRLQDPEPVPVNAQQAGFIASSAAFGVLAMLAEKLSVALNNGQHFDISQKAGLKEDPAEFDGSYEFTLKIHALRPGEKPHYPACGVF